MKRRPIIRVAKSAESTGRAIEHRTITHPKYDQGQITIIRQASVANRQSPYRSSKNPIPSFHQLRLLSLRLHITQIPKMKITRTASLLYLAATALAQATQLTELPECAIGCFQQAVVETTSCNPTDTTCLCEGDNAVKIEKRASGCVAANCENSAGK